jgi:transposase
MHLENGISVPDVAKMAKAHSSTVYRWLESYKKEGFDGLVDESRAPHSHPNEYPDEVKEKIRELRLEKNNRRVPGPIIWKLFGSKASKLGFQAGFQ